MADSTTRLSSHCSSFTRFIFCCHFFCDVEMELFYLGFHTSMKVMLITCDNLFKHPKGLKVLVIGTPVSYAL